MIELNVSRHVAQLQDEATEIATEIDGYSIEALNDIVLGDTTVNDVIREIESATDEAIDALRSEIDNINRQRALAVSHILRNT